MAVNRGCKRILDRCLGDCKRFITNPNDQRFCQSVGCVNQYLNCLDSVAKPAKNRAILIVNTLNKLTKILNNREIALKTRQRLANLLLVELDTQAQLLAKDLSLTTSKRACSKCNKSGSCKCTTCKSHGQKSRKLG